MLNAVIGPVPEGRSKTNTRSYRAVPFVAGQVGQVAGIPMVPVVPVLVRITWLMPGSLAVPSAMSWCCQQMRTSPLYWRAASTMSLKCFFEKSLLIVMPRTAASGVMVSYGRWLGSSPADESSDEDLSFLGSGSAANRNRGVARP